MISYEDDEELQRYRLSAALWRRMLVHAHPYWRAFVRLAAAGLASTLCSRVSLVRSSIARLPGEQTESRSTPRYTWESLLFLCC